MTLNAKANYREIYGAELDDQGLAEIRNLVAKRDHPRRRGKQTLIARESPNRETWAVNFRGQWIRIVFNPIRHEVITILAPAAKLLHGVGHDHPIGHSRRAAR